MAARSRDNDLVDDREYAAPRELVFECWTNAEHFARWFAPDDVDVPTCQLDARPGGALRFQHRFATGEIVTIRGVFDEVVRPERVRFTFTFVDEDGRPVPPAVFPEWPAGVHIVMTIDLFETAGGTRMTVRQHALERDAEALPAVVRHRELAGVGWRETAARLVAYLAEQQRC